VHFQTILHASYAAHRLDAADELLNFVREHRTDQDDAASICLNFKG
jgi:hypothetical protein